jgi:hypothetical protein
MNTGDCGPCMCSPFVLQCATVTQRRSTRRTETLVVQMADIETRYGGWRPQRISHIINRKPGAHLLNAINLAQRIGRKLNHFVTLNFDHTDCPPEAASRQFEKLRDNYFGPWLRRDGPQPPTPPTFVWSIENEGACAAHWLVHIPDGRLADFKRRLPAWLNAVAGEVRCPSAIHTRDAPTPGGAGKYMVKAIDPVYAPLYGIRHVPQGVVHGKRSGFSRCLGPSVRRRMQQAGEMPPLRKLGLPRAPARRETRATP